MINKTVDNRQKALEGVQRYTDNEDLQAFLCGQFGDYGKSATISTNVFSEG